MQPFTDGVNGESGRISYLDKRTKQYYLERFALLQWHADLSLMSFVMWNGNYEYVCEKMNFWNSNIRWLLVPLSFFFLSFCWCIYKLYSYGGGWHGHQNTLGSKSSRRLTVPLTLEVKQISPRVLLFLCCPPQAAVVLWLWTVIDCVCSWMSYTRTEPLITLEAMDEPRAQMQSGLYTVSSVSQPHRWTRG